MGSLLVGSSFAKSMALGLNIPLISVHHMHAHILAHFIDEGQEKPTFPFIGVTISGGHTQILQVNSFFDMEVLGETTEDRKSTRLNSSHVKISYAVFCLKKKKEQKRCQD